jgi:hypothetical protein
MIDEKLQKLIVIFWKHENNNNVDLSFKVFYKMITYLESKLDKKRLMFKPNDDFDVFDEDGDFNGFKAIDYYNQSKDKKVCHDFIYEDLIETIMKLPKIGKKIDFNSEITILQINNFVEWVTYLNNCFGEIKKDESFEIVGRELFSNGKLIIVNK